MSRIGKLKIPCPETVKVSQTDDRIVVKGPNGELSEKIHPFLSIRIESDGVRVEKDPEQRKADALSGLTRTLIANMVQGVTEGYKRELEIVGVGYRAELSGDALALQLGYSHRINFPLPKGITAEVPKPTQIVLKGIDKALLGQTAAKIRDLRKPEPYKGKGIKYVEEKIRRKVGKAGAK
jgi:large subunit ribosomal protein L6